MGVVRAAWLGVVACAVACGTLLEVGDDAPANADGGGTVEAGAGAESGSSSGSLPTCSAEVPTSIDFGEIFTGSSTSRPLVIKNLGDTEATWQASVNGSFTVTPSTFTVPALGSLDATVTYAPQSPTAVSAVLSLTTSGGCKFDVTLSGSGVSPDSFAVSPLTVNLVGPCKGTAAPSTLSIVTGSKSTSWAITPLAGIPLTTTPDAGFVGASSNTSAQISTTQTLPDIPGAALDGQLSLKLGAEAAARTIPVKATAQGAYISLSPSILVLIPIVGGTLKVENTGNTSATITLAADAPFKLSPSTLTLAAKSSKNVQVTTVNQSGTVNSKVTFTSSDVICGSDLANVTAPAL